MKIVNDYPPNYRDITAAIPSADSSKPIYCYGETIYNPHGRTITADLEKHESVHARQQAGNPDTWWYRYLSDPGFRLAQELEAYGEQFAFVRPLIHGQLRQWALDSMAKALSSDAYGNLLSHAEAASKIRNYATH